MWGWGVPLPCAAVPFEDLLPWLKNQSIPVANALTGLDTAGILCVLTSWTVASWKKKKKKHRFSI